MPTLLLSDDSLITQRMVAITCAPENIAVILANDGEEAIGRIRRERPDIVLASIATAKRSGYDVAAFVKSTPGLSSVPVLLVAAAFEPVDQKRAEQVRCDGVLVKPFEPQQLVARVRELLSRGAAAPDRSDRPPETDALDSYFEHLGTAFATRAVPPPRASADDGGSVPTLDSVLESGPSSPSPAPAITDELVEEVTRRVAERLGTPAVRQVVADIVADVAERLVREEIARIRAKK